MNEQQSPWTKVPPNRQQASENALPRGGVRKHLRRLVQVLGRWLLAFWSVALCVVMGAGVFQETIQASIASTPHPELVFVIFAAAASAVALAAWTLVHYLREEALAHRLQGMTPTEQARALQRKTWRSEFDPLHELLVQPRRLSVQVMTQKAETEVFAGEERLMARLNLATYLGNSLVGIGLVGTFIGLLQSLADLGALFASLMNAGSASADPVAMFSDMLRRLQEPMKGMGTAFVASLYGVMGSLVMGLVMYGVRRSGEHATEAVRLWLRHAEQSWHEVPAPASTPEVAWGAGVQENTQAVRDLSSALGERAQVERDLLQRQGALLEAVGALDQQVQARSLGLIESLKQVLDAQQLTHRQMLAQSRRDRRWTRLAWMVQGLMLALLLGLGMLLWGFGQQVGALKDALDLGLTMATSAEPEAAPNSPPPLESQAPPVAPLAPTPTTPSPSGTVVWTVRPGDSLWRIAHQHGIGVADLVRANPALRSADAVLLEGTRLVVPLRAKRD